MLDEICCTFQYLYFSRIYCRSLVIIVSLEIHDQFLLICFCTNNCFFYFLEQHNSAHYFAQSALGKIPFKTRAAG